MTSSSDTFPFGIADVVELLGLTRPPPSAVEPVPELPLCGDLRGRLNVNTDKMSGAATAAARRAVCWHCMPAINCTGNADAYREDLRSTGAVYAPAKGK